jgi:hypothetical protein
MHSLSRSEKYNLGHVADTAGSEQRIWMRGLVRR